VNVSAKSAIPAVPDRHVVDWTCPWKVYVGSALQRDVRLARPKEGERRLAPPDAGENLLADRASTRSAWQRCPSWLVKFDATEKDGDARVYRLTQCERNAGMLNVFTDAFLRHGNGKYRLSFEARARCGDSVPFEAHLFSNEKRTAAKFTIPNDGAWHRFDISLATDFDMDVTELAALFLKAASLPADEVCFKNLSLTKEPK
jgi:hypothetical protein